MDIPKWGDMDQKQRITAIAGGVLMLIAVVLIARGLFGGGEAPEVDPSAVRGIQSAVQDGTIKSAPPVEMPEDVEPVRRKGAITGD